MSEERGTSATKVAELRQERHRLVELFVTRVLLPLGDADLYRETVDQHVLDENLRAKLLSLLGPEDQVARDVEAAAPPRKQPRLVRWWAWLRHVCPASCTTDF